MNGSQKKIETDRLPNWLDRSTAIENIEARNEADMDVAGYVKPVLLRWERIALPEGYKDVSQILHSVLGEKVEKLRAMHLLPRNVTVTKRMLLDLGETLHRRLASRRAGYLFGATLLQSQAISLQHAIELAITASPPTSRKTKPRTPLPRAGMVVGIGMGTRGRREGSRTPVASKPYCLRQLSMSVLLLSRPSCRMHGPSTRVQIVNKVSRKQGYTNSSTQVQNPCRADQESVHTMLPRRCNKIRLRLSTSCGIGPEER